MKKTLYRKIMLSLSLVEMGILIQIAYKIGMFYEIKELSIVLVIQRVLENSYVSSILCSIVAVVIIYMVQLVYSKGKLKEDFRCNEIIEEVYNAIERVDKISEEKPKRLEWLSDEEYLDYKGRNAQVFYEYYKKNRVNIELSTWGLSCFNNDILLESVQSCFLINLNFKLLGIVNNIKNRLPNLRSEFPEIKKLYDEYERDGNADLLVALGDKISVYLVDLYFAAKYWKDLLDYLGYDPTCIKMFICIYNSKYNIEEDIKQPVEIQNKKIKEIRKETKKAIWRYRIEHFWDD